MVVHDIFIRFHTNFKSFSKELFQPQKQFKELENKTGQLNQRFRKLGQTGQRIGRGFRFLTTGFKGFRMELLSVMFGAQMVSRAMFGLLKPAMQVVGIFELFGSMLTVLFLPIALWLLENFIIPLVTWFMDLDPSIQLVIGAFVLFAGVLAIVVSVGAALLLFIGGIVLMFSSLGGPVIMAIVAGFGLFIVAILVIIAVFVLLWIAAKENFLGIGDLFKGVWESIVNVFSGAWKIIKGIWEVMVGVLTGDWARVWKGIKMIASGAWQIISKGVWKLVVTIVKFLWELPGKVQKIMDDFVKFLLEGVTWLWTNRSEWIPKVIAALKEAGKLMLEWAKTIGAQMWGAIIGKIKGVFSNGEENEGDESGAGPAVPQQSGGYIPHTGLYKLHAGEIVQQAGSTFSPTINVAAGSNVDIEMLKTQLSSQWNEELNRMAR